MYAALRYHDMSAVGLPRLTRHLKECGGKGGAATDFIFLGSKIIADTGCSHEIKRRLLLRKKAMTNLDSILKSRDITLLTKAHIVKVMVFPVVMYRSESWNMKKAEHQKIDVF